MLKRIRIKGFKSLKDVEVELKPLTVLFGPNASGKSNFLDALMLLSRIITGASLSEIFDPPYRGKPIESFTFGTNGIKGLLKTARPSLSFEADFELSDSAIKETQKFIENIPKQARGALLTKPGPNLEREKKLKYSISIGFNTKNLSITTLKEQLVFLTKEWKLYKVRKPIIDFQPPGLVYNYVIANLRHRPIFGPPATISPYFLAMSKEFSGWHFIYFEPRERMRILESLKETRNIGPMGEKLASFLNTLRAKNPKQFNAIGKSLSQIIPSVNGLDSFTNDDGEADFNLIEDKRTISSRLVSEGTLRILGFLAIISIDPPPILIGIEEPENGIHPKRIRLLADLLKTQSLHGNTQIIVATHSPTLIEHIPEEYLYVCRKRDGYTVIDPFTSLGPLGRKISKKKRVEKALEEKGEPLSISERILRGDFDDE